MGGTVSAFIEQPHPAVVSYRDELMDHIPLLSVDTGMDPHEVYGLMSCVAETATPPTANISLNSKITSNAEDDLQTAMVFFRMADHVMTSAASKARGEASIPGRKYFGCNGHVAHDGDPNHLWLNFP